MYDGQAHQYGKYLFYFAHTAYGDGLYSDNRGNKYGVDAGIIGIINMPTKKMRTTANKLMKDNLAAIVTFDKPFDVDSSGGVFNFGYIEIDTAEEKWWLLGITNERT